MDQILNAKIYNFLQLENPTEEEIIQGATLLLQCNPNRNRGIFNTAMKRPKAMLPWVRTDLKKFYDIRQRGLKTEEVTAFNKETEKRVKEQLERVPEDVMDELEAGEEDEPHIPVIGSRGRRDDHDELPDEIKALWDKNSERWKKMSRLHTQLSQMIAQPGYSPCDGNELCYLLRQTDTAMRNDYKIYDSYKLVKTEKKTEDEKSGDKLDQMADNMKAIGKARTAISRELKKEEHTEASLAKLQDAVNTLFSLKQAIKAETIEKLKALDIAIPDLGELKDEENE